MTSPYADHSTPVKRISINHAFIIHEEKRGEILEFFQKKLNKSYGYVCGRIGKGKSIEYLRELRSDCIQAEARSINFTAAFLTATKKPKKKV